MPALSLPAEPCRRSAPASDVHGRALTCAEARSCQRRLAVLSERRQACRSSAGTRGRIEQVTSHGTDGDVDEALRSQSGPPTRTWWRPARRRSRRALDSSPGTTSRSTPTTLTATPQCHAVSSAIRPSGTRAGLRDVTVNGTRGRRTRDLAYGMFATFDAVRRSLSTEPWFAPAGASPGLDITVTGANFAPGAVSVLRGPTSRSTQNLLTAPTRSH